MIPIKSIPRLPWTENSAREIAAIGDSIFRYTDCAWQFGDILIVGLCYPNFLSPPWMWFALTKNVKFRDLIDFRTLQDRIPKGTCTAIADDFPVAKRFAKFYGFVETDQHEVVNGRDYSIYRRV